MIHLAAPLIGDEEIDAVTHVLLSGHIAQGQQVALFENEFVEVLGTGTAVAVANGTLAIVLALQALDLEPGSEVIVPSFTFAATANAVVLAGAVPVFADIEPESFCIDPEHAATLVTGRTRAIIAVHLYGHMASMERLAELAAGNDLYLIEDAAQAHGAHRNGLPVGALSDLATYSFYPTKNMTTGEGGMVTSRNADLARAVSLLRNHGMERRYHHDRVGMNARMTDISAAIGRTQLRKLEGWNEQRRKIAATYDRHLPSAVDVPLVADDVSHVYHQYTIRTERRDHLIAVCEASGVGYGIYYPIPCHRQPAFARYARGSTLKTSDLAADEVLSIPIRPDLADNEVERVIDAITEGCKT
ncbi:MAG: DegT/DnrJ/EryC1/StrS family aminotransferase [Acidimicrobiia bacterium]|nr:DegT/DnrJ/EryC1/StrS family aminotransferase [Acidimicrobiia bacterium]